MAAVEIEYCVPCGFLDRAEQVQHALLTSLGERLDRVALVTGDRGVFEVRVAGECVYEKADGPLDPDEIVRQVRERL